MNKKICLILAWTIGVCAAASGVEAGGEHKIHVYLPREKTLTSELIELGQISVVLGDESLSQIANGIRLGQFSVPGQVITIDRKTILSRLASSGVNASSVVFNGAETISVCRHEDMILADRFVKTAQEYLKGQLSEEQINTLKLIRPVKDFPLDSQSGSVTLRALMSSRQSNRMEYVIVQVVRDGVVLGRQEVVFSVQYPSLRLVAKQPLPAGTLITPENTVVEKYMSNVPVQSSATSMYGMIAKRDIDGGITITEKMAEYKEAPVLIKRRQKVILKLDVGGLFVSAPGEAVEDGRLGDIISVQRGSRRTHDLKIVLGEVMPDGTVRPTL